MYVLHAVTCCRLLLLLKQGAAQLHDVAGFRWMPVTLSSRRQVKLTAQLHLVLRLKVCGMLHALPPLSS